MKDMLLLLLPIVLLVWLMTKPKSWASYKALPLVALVLFGIRSFIFDSSPTMLWASVIEGALTAWVPILVVWGALFLFGSMQRSGAMTVIKTWLEEITHNKIAQIMLIGWAFAFFIEGASGFGTPVALAAPILVRLGFKPLRVIMLCLVMNSIPVSFGAVGLPTWFGLGQSLGLSAQMLKSVAEQTAIMHFVVGFIIPIMALRFLVPWSQIKRNMGFVMLSILSCTIPALLLAQVSIEFPSLIGGMIGMVITAIAAHRQWGLYKSTPEKEITTPPKAILKATFPLWGMAMLLVLTRLDFIGLKNILTTTAVLRWDGILGTDLAWSHALLYVPSFIPFFVIGLCTLWLYRSPIRNIYQTIHGSVSRLVKPIISLTFALIFAKLLMNGVDAPSLIIGQTLSDITGSMWPAVSPFVGGVGSFFSGSNTVSNLTFGGMQMTAAQSLDLNPAIILAMQNVGGAMGNMICIANIIAGCSVLGISGQEGAILRQTIKPFLVYGIIVVLLGFVLLSN